MNIINPDLKILIVIIILDLSASESQHFHAGNFIPPVQPNILEGLILNISPC